MTAVFISYSSKDRKLAERLKTRLDKAKISSFFAPDRKGDGIEVGLEWQPSALLAPISADGPATAWAEPHCRFSQYASPALK